MERSDLLAEHLQACAEGDRAAFRDVYEATSRFVFGIAIGLLKDRDIASDVAQETFVRIWKRAGQFDAKNGNARAWIASITRNAAIDRIRAERARGFVTFSDELPDFSAELDPERHNLDAIVVQKHLMTLRPEYRKALLLCYFLGYTYNEVAEAMDIPEGTAKSWVRRGLAAMKEAMS